MRVQPIMGLLSVLAFPLRSVTEPIIVPRLWDSCIPNLSALVTGIYIYVEGVQIVQTMRTCDLDIEDSDFTLVYDHLGEAEAEVGELRRLLAEAERRRAMVESGQGELSWWQSTLLTIARWVWGEHHEAREDQVVAYRGEDEAEAEDGVAPAEWVEMSF